VGSREKGEDGVVLMVSAARGTTISLGGNVVVTRLADCAVGAMSALSHESGNRAALYFTTLGGANRLKWKDTWACTRCPIGRYDAMRLGGMGAVADLNKGLRYWPSLLSPFGHQS